MASIEITFSSCHSLILLGDKIILWYLFYTLPVSYMREYTLHIWWEFEGICIVLMKISIYVKLYPLNDKN